MATEGNNSSIRLLAFSELYHPVVGGSVRWISKIAEHWPGQAWVLGGCRPRGSLRPSDLDGPTPVRRIRLALDDWGLDSPQSLLQYANAVAQLVAETRRRRANVVLCGRGVPEGLIAYLAGRWTGAAYGCLVHGEETVSCGLSGQLRRMLRLAYSRADVLVCNSRASAELAAGAGGRTDRMIVSHPGVELSAFADVLAVDRGAGNDPPVLLTVGRLDERKNHAGVLRAMAELRRSGVDVRYQIVGDGYMKGPLEALVAELGLGDRVNWVHGGDDEIVRKAYCQADIFIMPAIHTGKDTEGFGIVFIEAALAGLPSIAGCVGGCKEAVLNERTGLVVDGSDRSALAGAIARLARDAKLRSRLGREGRRRASIELDWRALIPRLAGEMERMVPRAPRATSR
ncbi:MAG TPA: glycosyltransferase family 4 protein [Phycisphaerae bacterium]|nr:glycosyltransferase family 4 protein [Phycisphaerae bacterium]HQL74398.1 glycosyltransferase family 4 protein [Phycisphaerae bacterium]